MAGNKATMQGQARSYFYSHASKYQDLYFVCEWWSTHLFSTLCDIESQIENMNCNGDDLTMELLHKLYTI